MGDAPYPVGHARASQSEDPSNTAQRGALDAAGRRRVFEETASGGRWNRPKLREVTEKPRGEIAGSVTSGRGSGAGMARLFGVGAPTVSRVVAAYRRHPGAAA